MRARTITIALTGYAVAISVVFVVALIAIRSLDSAAADRLQAMRNHELRVTLAERLRWRSELKVAAGRGFVITGAAAFRQKLDQASASFTTLARDLRSVEDDRAALGHLTDATRASAAYDEAQDRLEPGAPGREHGLGAAQGEERDGVTGQRGPDCQEEKILFPMLRQAARGASVYSPVRVMESEHDEHGATLAEIRKLTSDFTVPPHACATWLALYRGLETVETELMEHIHLENNVLFARAVRER